MPLDQDDMMVMLQCLTGGLCKIGVTGRVPTVAELETIAHTMFLRADANNV